MIDPAKVTRLIEALGVYRSALSDLAYVTVDDYLDSHIYEGRYLIQASAQACIDIANHLISSEGWRVPRDFRDAFSVLEEHEVIDTELADRLQALAGLRNRLVHLYAEVDDARVHGFIDDGTRDLDAFATRIAKLVDEGSS